MFWTKPEIWFAERISSWKGLNASRVVISEDHQARAMRVKPE
jgi:hypothetical protein